MASYKACPLEWSKNYIIPPRHNLVIPLDPAACPGFKSSYERNPTTKPPMTLLLANEYSRIWLKERTEYIKMCKKAKKLKKVSDPLEKVKKRVAEKKEKALRLEKEKEMINERLHKASERAKNRVKKAQMKLAKMEEEAREKGGEDLTDDNEAKAAEENVANVSSGVQEGKEQKLVEEEVRE